MYSARDTPCGVSFLIRIFTGQSLLTAHRDFSQPATSFFASDRQGIHQMLFLTLDFLTTHRVKSAFCTRIVILLSFVTLASDEKRRLSLCLRTIKEDMHDASSTILVRHLLELRCIPYDKNATHVFSFITYSRCIRTRGLLLV
jgi:hypothetical protein